MRNRILAVLGIIGAVAFGAFIALMHFHGHNVGQIAMHYHGRHIVTRMHYHGRPIIHAILTMYHHG